MRKVEIFYNGDLSLLQEEINEWFTEHPRIIVEGRTQSEFVDLGEWHLTISIFYNEVTGNEAGD